MTSSIMLHWGWHGGISQIDFVEDHCKVSSGFLLLKVLYKLAARSNNNACIGVGIITMLALH